MLQTLMSAVREVTGVNMTATMLLVPTLVAATVAIVLIKTDSIAVVCRQLVHSHNMLDYNIYDSDIDECAEETDNCDEKCTNTLGSYFCNCTQPGYQLQSDGIMCESNEL